MMNPMRRVGEFQSTLPRGERHIDLREDVQIGDVSIHAPARGATAANVKTRICRWRFNPRSREGSDPIATRRK